MRFLEIFTVAPRPPTESEPPFLEKVQPQARNDADAFTEAEAHRFLVPLLCLIY